MTDMVGSKPGNVFPHPHSAQLSLVIANCQETSFQRFQCGQHDCHDVLVLGSCYHGSLLNLSIVVRDCRFQIKLNNKPIQDHPPTSMAGACACRSLHSFATFAFFRDSRERMHSFASRERSSHSFARIAKEWPALAPAIPRSPVRRTETSDGRTVSGPSWLDEYYSSAVRLCSNSKSSTYVLSDHLI